jgi:hypothetical protein
MAAKYCEVQNTAGSTTYVIAKRRSTGYFMANTSGGGNTPGAFYSSPSSAYVAMTPNAFLPTQFEYSESRVAWPNDSYDLTYFNQVGGSPDKAVDIVLAEEVKTIISDAEVDAATQTSVDNIPTVSAFEARTLPSADYVVVGDTIAGVTSVTNAVNVDASSINIEGTLTLKQALRIILAGIAGKTTGANSSSPTFRDLAGTKARISATIDGSGNRSSVTVDGTD